MKLTDVIRRPLITEKTSIQREDGRTIVFHVAPDANKTEIKEAIQQIWNVRVLGVNTINRKGKVKRTRISTGKRPDQKRAVVSLAEGDTIEIFEAKGP